MTSLYGGDGVDDFRCRSYSGGRLSGRAKHTRTRLILKSTKPSDKNQCPSSQKYQTSSSPPPASVSGMTDLNYGKAVLNDSDDEADCSGCIKGVFSMDSGRSSGISSSKSSHSVGQTDQKCSITTKITPSEGSLSNSTDISHHSTEQASTNNSMSDVASQAGRRRVLAHMHHVVRDEDWMMGEMRPRVASMPVRPSRDQNMVNRSRDIARANVETYMRRRFSITKRGVVKEGDTLVNRSSSVSIASVESPPGFIENTTPDIPEIPDNMPHFRILLMGMEGVGKKALLKEWGADLSVHMQTKEAPVSTSIMKRHPSLDEIPHRRRSYGHSHSYSTQKSDPSPSPGLYRPRSSSSCVPSCNKPDGMRSHGSNRALSHNTCLHQENTSICQKHGHDVKVMRPRVNTMPSVPNICINQYQYDVTPDLLLVRKFTIKRGKVTEGESVVRQSSVVSVVSTGSGGSSRSLSSSVDHELSRVLIHGNTGVGKCTLIGAFSKVNDSSVTLDDEGEKMVSVLLDGEESALEFVDVTDDQSNEFLTNDQVDAYVIVYSVEDRKSFEGAIDRLYELRNEEDDRSKAVILVANKSDLVRTRVILEEEGKSAAKTYDCKYIEVSAAIDHKVDELLVGIVKQIRLLRSKREALERHRRKATFGHHCCPIRPQQNMLGKLLGTRLFSSKSCENLYVL